MSSSTLYLVDGSGYIFRAFYAITSLTTRAGFPTNALFGFTRMLKKLLQEADSKHVVVVFDAGRDTFRLRLYPQYKANRKDCPDDLQRQMPYFRQIVKALGLPMFELPGFEADDIIGTLTRQLTSHGRDVVIVSGDKDLMQLIQPGVSIWDTMHDRHIGPNEVKEKFGVGPEKVVEVLALIGDSSDNVPGVDGVGPKTAAQLIEKYGDIENVIASIPAIREDPSIRNRKKIADQIELDTAKVRLSRRLVEIDLKTPIEVSLGGKKVNAEACGAEELLQSLSRAVPDRALLSELVEKLEFKSLLADLKLDVPAEAPGAVVPFNTKIILEKDFPEFAETLGARPEFAIDTETTSLNPLEAEVVGVSFSWGESDVYYLPIGHREAPGQVSREAFIAACGPILSNPAVKKIGQNLKYDIKVLMNLGVELKGVSFDTMVAAYLLKPDRGSYNLTVLVNEILGRPVIEYDQVVEGRPDFSYVSLDKASEYAGQDAYYAWVLKEALAPKLEQEGLREVFEEIEIPLVSVLAKMERTGVALNTAFLGRMSEEFARELDRIQQEIHAAAGCAFNINSPKQLSEILFDKLAIPTKGLKKTKTGVSTDSSVLEKLALIHPLPALILSYRGLHKLKSTYIDALPAQVSARSERLHTNFNQTVTGTGRLSSSEPNLQNIPVQTREGARIRQAFVAPPGKVLISADYSQIELRLLAHMSGDERMIAAFADDIDIHARTARQIFGLREPDEVSSEQRRVGKTINFGIVYGMGPYRLSRDLGIPMAAANKYIEDYFAHYPRVAEFFERLEKEAERHGVVRTMYGRRRLIADIDTTGRDKGFAIRAALNAPIQGSAADIIKAAMVNIDRRIEREHLPLRMVLQIHDELLFECEESYLPQALPFIRQSMEGVASLKVPLKVEAGAGKNWQEAKG